MQENNTENTTTKRPKFLKVLALAGVLYAIKMAVDAQKGVKKPNVKETTKNVSFTVQNPPPTVVVPPTTNEPQPPSNINIGGLTWISYGSSMGASLAEIDPQGGETKFYFYGQNGTYPTTRNGNGFETFLPPTHSINYVSGATTARSFCEYWLREKETNALVLYVKDTIGGYEYSNGNKRSNNHPDDAGRYLKTGNYVLEYKNISSPYAQKLIIFRQSVTIDYLVSAYVPSGASHTAEFSITDTGQEANALFKMNNNMIL